MLARTSFLNEAEDRKPKIEPQQQQQQQQREKESERRDDYEKCSICLQKFNYKSKSYASACFHSFCFECLLEWTKIKLSCPLCKKEFDRIIYDVKSTLEFKEYYMNKSGETPQQQILTQPLEIIAYIPPNQLNSQIINFNINLQATRQSNDTNNLTNHQKLRALRAGWLINKEIAPVEFRTLVYYNGWYVNPKQSQYDCKICNIDLEFNDEDAAAAQTSQQQASANEFLQCIGYTANTKVRSIKPDWFNQNPACTHRISHFIIRELKGIEGAQTSSSSTRLNVQTRTQLTTNIIKNLIQKYSIDSDEFLEEIKIYIKPIKYAIHFRHELGAYAKSATHDLVEYDSKCVYYLNVNQMPLENKSNLNDIFPFKSIPVNLNKYKLNESSSAGISLTAETRYSQMDYGAHRPRTASFSNNYYQSFIEFFDINQLRSSINVSHTGIDLHIDDEDSSHSEYSSYCEVISPPPKPQPVEITLGSSSADENSIASCSSRSKKSKKSKKSTHKRHKKKDKKKKSSSRRKISKSPSISSSYEHLNAIKPSTSHSGYVCYKTSTRSSNKSSRASSLDTSETRFKRLSSKRGLLLSDESFDDDESVDEHAMTKSRDKSVSSEKTRPKKKKSKKKSKRQTSTSKYLD